VRLGRRAGLLAAMSLVYCATGGSVASAQEGSAPAVRLFVVRGVSFEQLLDVPEVAALARSGGAGLMVDTGALTGDDLGRADGFPGPAPIAVWEMDPARLGGLDRVGDLIRQAVRNSPADEAFVVVTSTTSSEAMRAAGDDAHPIVVARGRPDDLFSAEGPTRTLTSDSTRRVGVVSDADLWPTISASQGGATPGDDTGSVIRVVDGPPPFELHERYLGYRRLTVPIGTAAALYVTFGGLFALGVVVVASRRRVSPVLGAIASGIALSVPVLGAALLAAGHLSTISYATVVPFLVAVTLAATAIGLAVSRRELLRGPALIATGVLAFLVVEAALGWTAALTPMLGGGELDGGRFYGMPNVETGLLLGASLWVAAVLPTAAGFALLAGAGLFAGLPFAGADLGGAVTMFAAAGMWPAVRARRHGWRDVALAIGVTVVGVGLVVVANRSLPGAPTHISAASDDGLSGAWGTFVHRLGIGIELIRLNPFAIVPVIGVVATLVAVLRPPPAVAPSLERRPAWRAALLTILLGSIVAYVANDTGPSAVGLGFGMAIAGLLYVSSADRTWKMEPA
jgi:hypothetical protein